MTKQFTFLQLFSIVDGRLATSMDDVYELLNHVCDDELMTHHLPVAVDYIKLKNPNWFQTTSQAIKMIVDKCQSNTFETLIGYIKDNLNLKYEVPQLKDEFDTSDFHKYMIDNSLLKKIGQGSE